MTDKTQQPSRYGLVSDEFVSTSHSVFRDYMPPIYQESVAVTLNDHLKPESNDFPLVPQGCGDLTGCAICLQNLYDPMTLVSCCHSFCAECLIIWYRKKIECPLCKASGELLISSANHSRNFLNSCPVNINHAHVPTTEQSHVKVWRIGDMKPRKRKYDSNISIETKKNEVCTIESEDGIMKRELFVEAEMKQTLILHAIHCHKELQNRISSTSSASMHSESLPVSLR